jgi:hypothetical protein
VVRVDGKEQETSHDFNEGIDSGEKARAMCISGT